MRHSSRVSGAGNPKWKGGATQRRQVHGAKGFRLMRPCVLAADGHKCVVCGRDDRRLEVHHLDSDPTNNRAVNLVTLCATHHREWHAAESRGETRWPWLRSYTDRRSLSMTSR